MVTLIQRIKKALMFYRRITGGKSRKCEESNLSGLGSRWKNFVFWDPKYEPLTPASF